MKRAIVSDIHGNLEALDAVLADIHDQGIDVIYCLGDIIGYGPNPRECIDKAREFDFCLLGNHDQGALFDPEGFSSGAEKAIFWTRQQLENPEGDSSEHAVRENLARWDFLCDLPRTKLESPFLFVHGSPRNPLNEYVFPEDVFNSRKLEKLFSLVEHYCFQGHTHVPGVFTAAAKFLSPSDLDHQFDLRDEKVMVNVGSVGQPRDNDPRSCYVVLEDRHVEFRRVEYPLERTIEKIYAIAELDRFLGDRLRQGR